MGGADFKQTFGHIPSMSMYYRSCHYGLVRSNADVSDNTKDKWWKDPCLRRNVRHCAGIGLCSYYLGCRSRRTYTPHTVSTLTLLPVSFERPWTDTDHKMTKVSWAACSPSPHGTPTLAPLAASNSASSRQCSSCPASRCALSPSGCAPSLVAVSPCGSGASSLSSAPSSRPVLSTSRCLWFVSLASSIWS